MGFTEQFALATDVGFVARVQQAGVTAAIALMNDPATPLRVANYCSSLLNNPYGMARNLAFGVAANGAITLESSDSDLQWTVNSVLWAYAGELPKNKAKE